MGFSQQTGRARVDPRRPNAFGVCDQCGFLYNLNQLKKQQQWTGPSLSWQGTLVCAHCYDKPQPQLRTIRLPPDPLPKAMPRPELGFSNSVASEGFTIISLWPSGTPLNYEVLLTDGDGQEILDNYGNPIQLEIGYDGIAMLAQISAITEIAVPGNIQNYNSTIALAGVAQALIPADPARTYIAIFNPCTCPLWISIGTAVIGVMPTFPLGPGDCAFWATAQGLGQPTILAMTAAGNYPGVPYYAYAC